jgi:AraC family transcriptional activator of pobA
MAKMETLEAFYKNKFSFSSEDIKRDLPPFNIFKFKDCSDAGAIEYRRRDFFKIALMEGGYIYHYGDKSIETTGPTLIFFNPDIPYTFEYPENNLTGEFCIFREAFFNQHFRGKIKDFPMFSFRGKPAYFLNELQHEHVSAMFTKMREEFNSDYALKYDLILNYITELIHYALKMEPTEKLVQNQDANVRIAAVFHELLERQFPVESVRQRFDLRSPNDFAERMAIHVNHLNRAMKHTTGKTTTTLIAERLIAEATALLKHTNWNISEISYTLGFEDQAHFNHFFKKHTRTTPTSFRTKVV